MSVASKTFTLWTADEGFGYAIARLLPTSRVSRAVCMKIRLTTSSRSPRLVGNGEEGGVRLLTLTVGQKGLEGVMAALEAVK